MNRPLALDRIRVVLSRTSHPGNIGAAARAMKTMGLRDLWLVAPEAFPDEVATARASGAADLLESARVVGTLQAALADTVFSAALTARRRELSLPRMQARDAAGELVARSEDGNVALVFGNETSGMTNEEVGLCSLPVTIPTDPEFSSLKLGAAVQVLCDELRMAALDPGTAPGIEFEPATHEQIEGFYAHLDRAITASGFFNPTNCKRLWPSLRRLFGRVRLEKDEVNILRVVKNPLTIGPELPTLEVMKLMRERRVSCLPVVEDGKLVGVITEADLIEVSSKLLENYLRDAQH